MHRLVTHYQITARLKETKFAREGMMLDRQVFVFVLCSFVT